MKPQDSEQRFEDLAKRWPDLFQKSGDFEFGIGDGWLGIVDILCGFLSSRVEQARTRLKYALENPTAKFVEPLEKLEQELADALEELPSLAQVKEKFGTMRFYMDGGSEKMHNYVSFAEAMTSRTCEVCGNPGKSRNDNWVKTLCDKHHKEREEANFQKRLPSKSPGPKLSDE
jgi:hypothetical protein